MQGCGAQGSGLQAVNVKLLVYILNVKLSEVCFSSFSSTSSCQSQAVDASSTSSCQGQAVGLRLNQAVKVCFSSFSSTSRCQCQAVGLRLRQCQAVKDIKVRFVKAWFVKLSVLAVKVVLSQAVKVVLSQAVKVGRVKPSRLSESSRQGCPSQAVKVVRVRPSRLSESGRQGCPSQAVKVPSSSMTMDR